MADTSTFALRLPKSVKAAVAILAEEDGVSMNQFVATAVAEKLSAMRTATYFEQHASQADPGAFRRLLRRPGGEAPRVGDELPAAKDRGG